MVCKGNECCKILENIYNKEFITTSPSWLKNPITGECITLDYYCDELKIALEYHGPHHFKKIDDNFLEQMKLDHWKAKKCREQNVKLIIVPYWAENLEDYIKSCMKVLKIEF